MYNNGNSSKNVTGASVVDGTIANADIDASAAISSSKLSGALTSVSSHDEDMTPLNAAIAA